MPPLSRSLAALVLALGAARMSAADTTEAEREALKYFENQVRPLLAHRCFECHGPKKQKAGLRLDSRASVARGGESGSPVVPGKPDDSLLIQSVRRTHADVQMPPDDPLPAAEVAVMEKWVALGAPFPEAPGAPAEVARDAHGFTAEDRKYWAFQPVADPTPPALPGNRWVRGDLDRFVAAKHAELGLAPAPEADRAELVRRIYFDVHGLPPTPAQSEAFVADRRPDAYERLVDDLLASPRYGERWAQHWLDLVRFAESDGYRADGLRPGAWPYRDWVIASLNADKPYDRFVREQLAGDEIAPDDPAVLIATSYLRNPIYEWNQRDVRGQADLIVDDLTANAGEVFLGLSMGCARCHDHKFDPILQKDYYSLRAFFEPVLWRSDLTLATPEERARHAEQQAKWEAATAELRARRDALVRPPLERAVKRAHDRFTDDIQAMLDKPVPARAPQEHILATMAYRQMEYEEERFDPLKALKKVEEKRAYQAIETELKRFDALKPKPLPEAFVATDAGPVAPPTKMKSRRGGEREVGPAFLTLLEPTPPEIAPLPASTGRRSALAAWIVRPDNPLSTRVIVNRVWQYHFGRGLAGTPNDLGRLGERPTHPELLDWLARRFVAGGWSLKRLHRDILLSATYRQTARIPVPEVAARIDPANRYLWRFSPRRLDAEQVRDAVLAATGELDLAKVGGPSQDANTSPRRSIYTTKKRNNQNELLRALDAPPGFSSTAERQGTSTPLQALLFMNGDWMNARARKLAAQAGSPAAAWQAVLGRAPTAPERALAEAFLAQRTDAVADPAPPLVVGGAELPPGRFHEQTARERVVAKHAPREGDDFTVEAIVAPDSVDAASSVRVIASRWTGDKSALEAHGWSLGLTGRKSAHKPLNLILQVVGEDDNMNTGYEVVASGLFLKLGALHHVAAKVSYSNATVTFYVKDLGDAEGAPRTATKKLTLVGKLGSGQAPLAIGGLARRSPHQFDGTIQAVRVVPAALGDDTLGLDPARWRAAGGLVWEAAAREAAFEAAGSALAAEETTPQARALADLCHVLLNSNEFLYLH